MTPASFPSPLRVGLAVPLLLGLACVGDSPAPGNAGPAALTRSESPAAALGDAFVVWESNRAGEFRIFRQDLGGGAPSRISAAEPGRDHCCAKLSPDGSRLVYLSLPAGARKYRQDSGVLHLVDADGGRDRVLVAEARHYGEHRAAVWWGEDELVYLDGRGVTRELRLSTGASTELAAPAGNGEGWLIAPGGRVATANTPTFSDYVAGRGVSPRPSLGGCQPAFSNDGRFAVWSAGAGGPVDAIDLATRRTWTVLEKGDPHFPADRGYLYFPMLSNDASMLAVGASTGEHDHFRTDYDIYTLELAPDTLLPASAARPVAPHPAVDRFPDLYRRPGAVERRAAQSALSVSGPALAEARPRTAAEGLQRGLVFLWRSADAENRIDAESGSEVLQSHALAWIDRHRALALGGGFFSAAEATGRRLAHALVAKHQLTLALLVTPASLREQGAIVAFSDGPRDRNFVLRQEGNQIVYLLRTADSAQEGAPVAVTTLTSTAPLHLLLTFSPGRFQAYVAGSTAPSTAIKASATALPGDFFPWRRRAVTFGAEEKNGERWRGTLSEIAIWNRPLGEPEIAGEVARVRTLLAARPVAMRQVVEARLRATSPVPSLEEISPYREALAVDELEVLRQISGPPLAGNRIRVARWAILDNQVLAPPRVGEDVRLVLEPFAAQPQLEPFFLADRLPSSPGLPLFFDLGATAAP